MQKRQHVKVKYQVKSVPLADYLLIGLVGVLIMVSVQNHPLFLQDANHQCEVKR